MRVPPPSNADGDIGNVWRWVALERQRADRAAAVARRHEEQLAHASESMRAYHQRLAALYRRIEQRHVASGLMQAVHATRLRRWANDTAGRDALRPLFMTAVAAILGTDSAAVTLFGQRRSPAMVAASDDTARAAHDLEFVLGEGPTIDAAARGKVIVAGGPVLVDRWPQYGAAVTELGVRSVVAMPLALPTVCIGTLCGFDSRSDLRDGITASADRVADALTHAVLHASNADDRADDIPYLPLFDEADFQAVIHQAAGMVSVRCDCDIDDALAMLRARAFADGLPLDVIAARIVAGTLRLS